MFVNLKFSKPHYWGFLWRFHYIGIIDYIIGQCWLSSLQKVEGECGLENFNLIIMIWFFSRSVPILKLSRDTQPFTSIQKDTQDSGIPGVLEALVSGTRVKNQTLQQKMLLLPYQHITQGWGPNIYLLYHSFITFMLVKIFPILSDHKVPLLCSVCLEVFKGTVINSD